jgi:hypothetical protein
MGEYRVLRLRQTTRKSHAGIVGPFSHHRVVPRSPESAGLRLAEEESAIHRSAAIADEFLASAG